MKKTLFLLALLFTISANAQEDKTVTLVVSGQGKTHLEARQVALRSAIEQAFGTFISSKTEVLNDSLVKDEIVSITNGNIQKFEPISEVQLPDSSYASTVRATVSVTKLTSFCESKGVSVEFKGGLFAANIKMQKLNEANEVETIRNICKVGKQFVDKMIDYDISSNEPKSLDGNSNNWEVVLTVGLTLNNNFDLLCKFLNSSLKDVALTNDEVFNYKSLNLNVYPLMLGSQLNVVYFRSERSLALLQDLEWYIDFAQGDFFINDGIKDFSIYEGKLIKDDRGYYVSNKIIFDLQRNFKSNWFIRLLGNDNGQNDFVGPLWGTAIANKGSTYELTKKNIKSLRLYYLDDERLQNSFADSSTVFMFGYNKAGHPNQGGLNNINGWHEELLALLSFNFNLVERKYGHFFIKKNYTTDELGKITSFSVKPGKLE